MGYPILFILRSAVKRLEGKWFERVKNLLLSFNLAYFFLLSIAIGLSSTVGFSNDSWFSPWTNLVVELMGARQIYFRELWQICLYLVFCFVLVTSGVFSLNVYFAESGMKRKAFHA